MSHLVAKTDLGIIRNVSAATAHGHSSNSPRKIPALSKSPTSVGRGFVALRNASLHDAAAAGGSPPAGGTGPAFGAWESAASFNC